MSIEPALTFQLNQTIVPGLITVGKFDGVHECLACATKAGKVFIYNGHETHAEPERRLQFLNISQTPICIAAGRFNASPANRDLLFVGTYTNILAYDVANNADQFYNEVPDGAAAIFIGRIHHATCHAPLVVCGGNCSIVGFDEHGDEKLWTVTGDNVTAITVVDFSEPGSREMVVGSEDCEIRVFKEDSIVHEVSETGIVTNLCAMGGSGAKFGYTLDNGTIGVYDGLTRLWRIKSKNRPVCIVAFDINSDGNNELIIGWNSNKIDARKLDNGDVVFRESLSSAVAGLAKMDYYQNGKEMLIMLSIEGEAKAYYPLSKLEIEQGLTSKSKEEQLYAMNMKKQNLLAEVHNYEVNSKINRAEVPVKYSEMSLIPANTQVNGMLHLSPRGTEQPGVEFKMTSTNDTIIRSVIIFAEGIFDSECLVLHPNPAQPKNTLSVTLRPEKNTKVDLFIMIFVGMRMSNAVQFHVFEMQKTLPRFSMYRKIGDEELGPQEVPSGFVKFALKERVERIILWINQNFLLEEPITKIKEHETLLRVNFRCLRSDCSVFIFLMEPKNEQVTIKTDDIDFASQIVQNLVTYLDISDLNSICDFPVIFDSLKETVSKIEDMRSTGKKLLADIADHSNLIKNLAIRAEDFRIIQDMSNLKRIYTEIGHLNRDLVRSFTIRNKNHQDLLSLLKNLNQIIQRAGSIRAGKYKNAVINECRNAIKNGNMQFMEKIIRSGCESPLN